ncbi:MAG: hypothetical protein LBK47_01850 [Prevotellaceae bacterium]|jgi:hypothetical protein|nr:hypothetical protein [Prevotellaceae bacterium]
MLEQFVNNHRDEFDSEEPTIGHELRFAKKIKPSKAKRRWIYYVSAAAAVALLVVSVKVFNRHDVCRPSEEVLGVQQYYSGVLMLEQDKLDKILACVDEQTRTEVMDDVEQMLSESAISASSLCHEQNNPVVIGALVEEYLYKIEHLQELGQLLQKNNPCSEIDT